jgi:hypothetical protein
LLFQNQRVFCEPESIASILLVVLECFWYEIFFGLKKSEVKSDGKDCHVDN